MFYITSSLLLKIIPIHLFYEVGAGGGNAEVVVNHVLGELCAVDENDFDVVHGHVVAGVAGEIGGCDENSFGGAFAGERTHESLNFRATNCFIGLPAFGLDVDGI